MKRQHILLIRPPCFAFEGSINPLPPIGLGYLASVARNAGYCVTVYDSLIEYWHEPHLVYHGVKAIGPDFVKFDELLAHIKPDIIGVSILFSNQHLIAMEYIKRIKKILPLVKIVVGGPHVSVLPEEIMKEPSVDYAVIGEGESTFLDVLKHIEGNFCADDFDGVCYRENGHTFFKEKTRFIENIDSIAFPAWDLMKIEKYFSLSASHGTRTSDRFMPIMTSRGCPANCVFCSAKKVWGKRFRPRSVENIIEEMRILKEKYNIEEIMFEDDNVTSNVPRAKKLFRAMIDEKLSFKWDTPNGVAAWTLSKELLDIMKQSGCIKLNIAIESGVQDVLTNIIRKPLKLDKIPEIIEYAREIGLNVSSFFIVGLPGETKKDILQTFEFINRHKLYESHISLATPYLGSELYEICRENGYLSSSFALSNLYLWSYSIETEHWSRSELKRLIDFERYKINLFKENTNPMLYKVFIFLHSIRYFLKSCAWVRIAYHSQYKPCNEFLRILISEPLKAFKRVFEKL